MSLISQGNAPGFTARTDSFEAELRVGIVNNSNPILTQQITIDSTVTDAGNTGSTNVIRLGNVMAIKASDGKAYLYDADAIDGTQIAVGLLPHTQDMNQNGVATDRFTDLMTYGVVKESQIIGLDSQARYQLEAIGIRIVAETSIETNKVSALGKPSNIITKAANYTVTAGDNGTFFIATAAVNFTLPTIAAGLSYRFLQSADANLIITGSNNIIGLDDFGGSTLTWSTVDNLIGSGVTVLAVNIAASTLKWAIQLASSSTMVVA